MAPAAVAWTGRVGQLWNHSKRAPANSGCDGHMGQVLAEQDSHGKV